MNTQGSDTVTVRQVNTNDKDFIFNSWLHSQYWSSKYYQKMPQTLFFKEYTRYITRLLVNPMCSIDVAVLDSDPNMVIGYLIYRGKTIHWAYVKKEYRSKGILTLLMKDKEFEQYTGSTIAGHSIAKLLNLIFNPFIN